MFKHISVCVAVITAGLALSVTGSGTASACSAEPQLSSTDHATPGLRHPIGS
ncbi:hypothetical protein MHW47_19175 [Streptomyces sp. OfavH-34-F]|uniref:hypothetical protein n=1 Tax=unclassified Streptomyces TaxID=2593676 RepID=UPI001EF3AE90|nr:hypothetical protein [Streptomyces sp. OfavH-34-F]MCG7526562.1 hypothetical protein [Streptomyces sp. OfavH-34-F]